MKKELALFLLRIALGWLFLYAGLTKLTTANWSALFYLKDPQNFPWLFQWFALPSNIGWVSQLTMWGETLIGIALLLGIFVPIAAISGMLMMLLFYLPILKFPYPDKHSLIVNDHVIYALSLFVLWQLKAGKYWGLSEVIKKILPKPLKALN